MNIAVITSDVAWQKFKKYYCIDCEQRTLICDFKEEI